MITVGDHRRSAATVAEPLDGARHTWTTLEYRPSLRPVTDGPGRVAHSYGTDALIPVVRGLGLGAGRTNQQAGRLICARICARDAAGHAETGETQKAWYDFMPQVCRGQRGERRLSETGETYVVVLITQRSRVQIPPPATNFRRSRPFPGWERAFCVTGNVTKVGCRAVRRGLRGETGWHAARQRGTRWTTSPAIAGRPARRYRRRADIRAGPTRARTHAGISMSGGAIPRRSHGQCPCARPALPITCFGAEQFIACLHAPNSWIWVLLGASSGQVHVDNAGRDDCRAGWLTASVASSLVLARDEQRPATAV
jgi:hypothetical protein